MNLTTTERYRYLTQRRVNNIPARHALYIARGSVAFDKLDTEPERQAYRVLERDGMEFHIAIEFDHDAFEEFRADELGDDGKPLPQWWYAVTVNGLHVDSCGGIGGGYWDGRDEPDMDDAIKACLWAEFIDPACDPAAIRAEWASHIL